MEIDNAVEATGAEHVGRLFKISLPMWANGLRLIDEGASPSPSCAAGPAPHETSAAWSAGDASALATGPAGVPAMAPVKGLRVDTVIRPTRAGRYARRLFPEMVGMVEQRWRDRFGAQLVDTLVKHRYRTASGMTKPVGANAGIGSQRPAATQTLSTALV